MTTDKTDLHDKLRAVRGGLLSRLDGLSEYDVRRPMTSTGTNLLGLVKHLIAVEQVYLGTSFGRPPRREPPWVTGRSIWEGADMWATEDESRELIDGRAGADHDLLDEAGWTAYVAGIQAAADTFS